MLTNTYEQAKTLALAARRLGNLQAEIVFAKEMAKHEVSSLRSDAGRLFAKARAAAKVNMPQVAYNQRVIASWRMAVSNRILAASNRI